MDNRIIAIQRDTRFSPNSVSRDREIFELVCREIDSEIPIIDESQLSDYLSADVYISMARLPESLSTLEKLKEEGRIVINDARAVESCTRSKLDTIMTLNNIPKPPQKGENGYWLKRGDAAAQEENDVVFCPDEESLQDSCRHFIQRGISDYTISAHVVGDVIKFYGVSNGFFRYFYPTDDHHMKFKHELINGKAHHYAFDVDALKNETTRLAKLIGIDVYGGDVIVDKNGLFYIIDFNDWPSFSRCKTEAAKAISQLIKERI